MEYSSAIHFIIRFFSRSYKLNEADVTEDFPINAYCCDHLDWLELLNELDTALCSTHELDLSAWEALGGNATEGRPLRSGITLREIAKFLAAAKEVSLEDFVVSRLEACIRELQLSSVNLEGFSSDTSLALSPRDWVLLGDRFRPRLSVRDIEWDAESWNDLGRGKKAGNITHQTPTAHDVYLMASDLYTADIC